MSKKSLGLVLVGAGIVMLVVSLGADAFGLGSHASFGWKQASGAIAGLLLGLYGGWLAWSASRSTK